MTMEYYTRRLKESLAAAKAATEPTSRIAHEGMAKAYRGLLDTVVVPLEQTWRRIRPETRDDQLRKALDDWENEGGGNRK